MQPSPAERWYLEERAQHQAAWRAARLADAALRRQSEHVSAYEFVRAGATAGGSVSYEEISFEVGTVQTEYEVPIEAQPVHEIPGQFGTALSLVGQVRAGSCSPNGGTWLWWRWVTSLDGENWLSLVPITNEMSYAWAEAKRTATARILGPFADRLGIQFGIKNSRSLTDSWYYGTFEDVSVTVGVQRF